MHTIAADVTDAGLFLLAGPGPWRMRLDLVARRNAAERVGSSHTGRSNFNSQAFKDLNNRT